MREISSEKFSMRLIIHGMIGFPFFSWEGFLV